MTSSNTRQQHYHDTPIPIAGVHIEMRHRVHSLTHALSALLCPVCPVLYLHNIRHVGDDRSNSLGRPQ